MSTLSKLHQQHYTIGVIGSGIHAAAFASEAARRGYTCLVIAPDDLLENNPAPQLASTNIRLTKLERLALYDLFRSRREQARISAEHSEQIKLCEHFILPNETVRSEAKIRLGMQLLKRAIPQQQMVDLNIAQNAVNVDIPTTHRFSDILVHEQARTLSTFANAQELGAEILNHVKISNCQRQRKQWLLTLTDALKPQSERQVSFDILINSTGSQATYYLEQVLNSHSRCQVKPVFYAYALLNKHYQGQQGYVMQADDGQLIFVTPVNDHQVQLGPFIHYKKLSKEQLINNLLNIYNQHFQVNVQPEQVISINNLERAACEDPCENNVTQLLDTLLDLSAGQSQRQAPVLSLFGYNFTFHTLLADKAMGILGPFLPTPARKPNPTSIPQLAPQTMQFSKEKLMDAYPFLATVLLERWSKLYGAGSFELLANVTREEDLGTHYGDHFYHCELAYLVKQYWVRTFSDLLRRLPLCDATNLKKQQELIEQGIRQLN